MTRKCKVCKTNEAEWIMQYVGEDTPSFTLPGYHYRGFPTTPVCDDCKNRIIKEAQSEKV